MKRIIYKCLPVLLFIAIMACKKIDNYKEPDAGIEGTVTDVLTNTPLQTEQPNGVRIRLVEQSSDYPNVQPYDVWAKPDGTFKSTYIFSGDYKVQAIEGAFFPIEEQRVLIKGMTQINFIVTPFLRISATVATTATGITASYQISRTQIGAKIQEAKLWVSSVPTVSNVSFDAGKSVARNLSAIADATILTTTYTDVINGLVSGKTYYIRVGARTNTTPTRFNYTPIVEVKIP